MDGDASNEQCGISPTWATATYNHARSSLVLHGDVGGVPGLWPWRHRLCHGDSAFCRGSNVCIIPGSRQYSYKHMYYKLFVTPFMFFSQGTPAGLVRYKVDPEAYPYSASIFDVDEKTGNVVTRVNLNEEPSLKFNVRNYCMSSLEHHCPWVSPRMRVSVAVWMALKSQTITNYSSGLKRMFKCYQYQCKHAPVALHGEMAPIVNKWKTPTIRTIRGACSVIIRWFMVRWAGSYGSLSG